jgi:hypothetical protein
MQNRPDMVTNGDTRLRGDTGSISEFFAEFGLSEGGVADLRDLIPLERDQVVEVYLYFDPDLARSSSLEQDCRDFQIVSELSRPFLQLTRFLDVMTDRDPGFAEELKQEPLMVEVLELGVRHEFYGCVIQHRPFVKVLLPER